MSSMLNWRKSAIKDVRPFFGTVSLEDALGSAELQVNEDGPFSPEPAYVIEPADMSKLRLTARLNFKQAAMSFDTVKRSDLVLAVTVVQPFMKKTIVVGTYAIDKDLPEEVTIGEEILAALGGGLNINVDLALCLKKKLPKEPGSPFLFGHWLSKKSFTLRPPKLAEEFDIEPTEDDAWKKLGYPPKTLYLVEYFGGVNEPVAKDKQTARIRVHADIYKKLTAESQQRLAKPILNSLAAELACQMLATSISDWEGADEVVPQSPLSSFMKRINRVQHCTLDDLKGMAKQPGMPKLRALLHADQQTVRSIAEA
jgi:hypothetical protein